MIREGLINTGNKSASSAITVVDEMLEIGTNKVKIGFESTSGGDFRAIIFHVSGAEPSDVFWSDSNPYAHMMFHEEWSIDSIQTAAQTLSYAGMIL